MNNSKLRCAPGEIRTLSWTCQPTQMRHSHRLPLSVKQTVPETDEKSVGPYILSLFSGSNYHIPQIVGKVRNPFKKWRERERDRERENDGTGTEAFLAWIHKGKHCAVFLCAPHPWSSLCESKKPVKECLRVSSWILSFVVASPSVVFLLDSQVSVQWKWHVIHSFG